MRLVTFETETVFGNVRRAGVLDESSKHTRVVDLQIAYIASLVATRMDPREATRIASSTFPHQMEQLIAGGWASLEAARQVVEFVTTVPDSAVKGPGGHPGIFQLDQVKLRCPLSRPNSLRDFLAFEDHAKGGAERRGETLNPTWYERPIYYKGNHRSLIGHEDDLVIPSFTDELDFEMEVACIVGAGGTNLSEADAASSIFGFTILNDWSARDLQRTEMAARLGPAKSKDFANSLGPCIVTADEVGPQPALQMAVKVNGKTMREANLSEAFWTFPKMISFVSTDEATWPTDIYGSGTPFGGCMLDQGGPYLKHNDVVEIEVEKIGVLRNRVIKRSK